MSSFTFTSLDEKAEKSQLELKNIVDTINENTVRMKDTIKIIKKSKRKAKSD